MFHSHRPACRDVADKDLFFPIHVSSDYEDPTRQEQAALRICAGCPVRESCLALELSYGLSHQHGVVGGMTENQRRALLRASQQRVA